MPTLGEPPDQAARRFAAELTQRCGLPVDLVDERWSSQDAEQRLREQRANGTRARRVTREAVDAERGGDTGTLVRKTNYMTEQTRPNGTLRHLLTLEGLSKQHIEALLTRAQKFVKPVGEPPVSSRTLAGITVANMFTEPSTRTRVSFELAAKRLGADVVNLEMQLSSRVKGESMLDTIYTLEACHVDVFVIRDAEAGVPGLVASHVQPHASVLSAGEAHVAHPTQAC